MRTWLFCFLLLLASAFAESAFPDLPGSQTLLCDFHMHTVFSDGLVWPTVRVDEARREGLDVIAITDHIEYQPHRNDIPTSHERPYEIAAKKAAEAGILLIRGAEITRDTPPGHYNAIFLNDIDALVQDDFLPVIETANRQGGFVFWNHHEWQGARKGDWTPLQTTMADNQWLDGMEVANGNDYYPRAHQWCLEKNLTMFGNSDIHGPALWKAYTPDDHRTLTLVFAREKSPAAVREALDQGRTAAWVKNRLIGRSECLEPLFQAAVKTGPVYRADDGSAWVDLSNKTGMDLVLVNLDSPEQRRVTVSAMATASVRLDTNDEALRLRVENFLIAPEKSLETELKIPPADADPQANFLLGGN